MASAEIGLQLLNLLILSDVEGQAGDHETPPEHP